MQRIAKDCNPLQRFDSDSNRIRIGFESGRIPVRFDYSIPTQFLLHSSIYPGTNCLLFSTWANKSVLGQIYLTCGEYSRPGDEYICKSTRERLLCQSNQGELPMDKKIVYSSRFVRVILAQRPYEKYEAVVFHDTEGSCHLVGWSVN